MEVVGKRLYWFLPPVVSPLINVEFYVCSRDLQVFVSLSSRQIAGGVRGLYWLDQNSVVGTGKLAYSITAELWKTNITTLARGITLCLRDLPRRDED